MAHGDIWSKTLQGKERGVDSNTLSKCHSALVDYWVELEICIQNQSSRSIKSVYLMRNMWRNM